MVDSAAETSAFRTNSWSTMEDAWTNDRSIRSSHRRLRHDAAQWDTQNGVKFYPATAFKLGNNRICFPLKLITQGVAITLLAHRRVLPLVSYVAPQWSVTDYDRRQNNTGRYTMCRRASNKMRQSKHSRRCQRDSSQ